MGFISCPYYMLPYRVPCFGVGIAITKFKQIGVWHKLPHTLKEKAKELSLKPRRRPVSREVSDSGTPRLKYPITGIAGCCARAASGHAAAAPPSVAKNFRRAMWLAM